MDESSSVASKFPTEAKGLSIIDDGAGPAKPRSKPIAGFVSTSVLSSSDGLFGDNVEEVRITDRPESADKVDSRPLYDRLKEQKDQRDADWKDKNNPFAPPKGLDDEEITFLYALEEDQKKIQDDIKRQHDAELAQFAMMKRGAHAKKPASVVTSKVDVTHVPLEKQVTRASVKPKAKKQKASEAEGTKPKKQKTAAVASLVAAYSDDSD
ncbi:Aste57867_9599 [Aphanomyces stellatus]|uniref:Aste57867_9599 protein n=1 Tax=Aphanomyces stellatus TaxID=120398 RepID=A0A485KNK4_9STRA|nr:hypothetical protein As57867_009561 [Aphanomyces stellatus]VFT86478.1 Aste57867_9599 [Aphanomyces stellatus]